MISILIRKVSYFKNFIAYGIIGGMAAVVDFSSFFLFHSVYGISPFISNIISMHLGMLVSFFFNAKFNFKKSDKLLKRFLSYYLIILCGMAISSGILFIGTFFTENELIVKLVSIIIVSTIQYIFNKFITFKF